MSRFTEFMTLAGFLSILLAAVACLVSTGIGVKRYAYLVPLIEFTQSVQQHRPDLWEQIRGMPIPRAIRSVYIAYGATEPPYGAPLTESVEGAIALMERE